MRKRKPKSLVEALTGKDEKRIEVEEAVGRAHEYFNRLYAGQGVTNVQLEEVELTDDDKYWFITLSYQQRSDVTSLIKSPRKYKIFQIHAETGTVKAMKIRNVINGESHRKAT